MPVSGPLSHLDISVGYPTRSIAFYDSLLTALGFRRTEGFTAEFAGPNPTRAGWRLEMKGGATFGIEVRPARRGDRDLRYDRYKPGPHHIAFHAENAAKVDQVHAAMLAVGTEVLDAPADYSGQPGYGQGYYAAFYADPDGVKVEVVYEPDSNR
jgi:catechol 2,3-dioxygenase-like lactoylglutathione lyase family enzyme